MKRKILLSLATTMLCSSALVANDNIIDSKWKGYTYFMVGYEKATYKEKGTTTSNGSFSSEASPASPVYMSGSLIRINNRYDFSMDLSSTLLPNTSDETWDLGGTSGYQTNKFESLINSMVFLGHYKFTNNHRFTFGPSYYYNVFKRHTFNDENGNQLQYNNGQVVGLSEEQVATLSLNVGYWYESASFGSDQRLKVNLLLGTPIWRQASSTQYVETKFDSTSGYSYEMNINYNFKIIPGLELGVYSGYNYQKKSKSDRNSNGILWPENELSLFKVGLSATWNFN